ncbi:hypothetical protein RUM44_009571 [Polyplax serrata]|uniref:HYR domain-containing protein n=1 Tax=Polyplax serrata TaxID=468196 RepID=A0ABR1AT38_POLSC
MYFSYLSLRCDFIYADTPPPFIHCPPDIKTELPPNKFSVYIKLPQPKSNVDWWRYVESHPPWAKRLEGDFPIGVTSIMFHARSPISNLTAACRFQVHVYDNKKPRVTYCPESFEVTLSEKDRNEVITWKEPVFVDNVRIDHIFKTREPGSSFSVGKHNIRYVATDPSGNQATCAFTITVRGESGSGSESNIRTYPDTSKLGRNFFKKLIVCPHLVAEAELMPSYLVSTRCFVQRHRLTRVLAEYPVQVYQHHRVRHNHDRLLPNHHQLTTSYPGRRELMKDEPERPPLKDVTPDMQNNDEKVTTGSTDIVLKISGGLLDNSTITVDTHSLIEQKTHRDRWDDVMKKYHSQREQSDSHPGDDVRLVEYERRRQEEDERMRRHEIEMRKWREEMRRYHMEIKRLQEDSRRYRAG